MKAGQEIRIADPNEIGAFARHMERLAAGSAGEGVIPYNPVVPGDYKFTRQEETRQAWKSSPPDQGWKRTWVIGLPDGGDEIFGSGSLNAWKLPSMAHRAELTVGLERPLRGLGLGRVFVEAMLAWARHQEWLDWVDLSVLAHNTPAVSLYERVGFVRTGLVRDRFRLGERSIDDLQMTFPLRP